MEESKEIRIPDVGNIEELVFQPSLEIALEKMRNGTRMYIRDDVWDSIFELRRMKGLDGVEQEFIIEYENDPGYPISNIDSLLFWKENFSEHVGKRHLTLSPEEAFELLKQGKCIETPTRFYFCGTIDSPMGAIKDVKYVFVQYKASGVVVLSSPLDNFKFYNDKRYGVKQ